jgi:hypothetical protein
MIRDYFGKIRKIIYNNQICKYGLYDNVDSHEIDQIIGSNVNLLKHLSNRRNRRNNHKIYQNGGDLSELSTQIDSLQRAVNKMYTHEIEEQNGEKRIAFIDMMGNDAINLIKFLGELVQQSTDETKKTKLIAIQNQIKDIVVELSQYLGETQEEEKVE